MLSDARARAQSIIDESLDRARELIDRRVVEPAAEERAELHGIRDTVVEVGAQVRALHSRLDRLETLLRRQLGTPPSAGGVAPVQAASTQAGPAQASPMRAAAPAALSAGPLPSAESPPEGIRPVGRAASSAEITRPIPAPTAPSTMDYSTAVPAAAGEPEPRVEPVPASAAEASEAGTPAGMSGPAGVAEPSAPDVGAPAKPAADAERQVAAPLANLRPLRPAAVTPPRVRGPIRPLDKRADRPGPVSPAPPLSPMPHSARPGWPPAPDRGPGPIAEPGTSAPDSPGNVAAEPEPKPAPEVREESAFVPEAWSAPAVTRESARAVAPVPIEAPPDLEEPVVPAVADAGGEVAESAGPPESRGIEQPAAPAVSDSVGRATESPEAPDTPAAPRALESRDEPNAGGAASFVASDDARAVAESPEAADEPELGAPEAVAESAEPERPAEPDVEDPGTPRRAEADTPQAVLGSDAVRPAAGAGSPANEERASAEPVSHDDRSGFGVDVGGRSNGPWAGVEDVAAPRVGEPRGPADLDQQGDEPAESSSTTSTEEPDDGAPRGPTASASGLAPSSVASSRATSGRFPPVSLARERAIAAIANGDDADADSAGHVHGDNGVTFARDEGAVTLRVSPVAGFQGLMRVQDALVRLSEIEEAGVEAYAQGEARLRLRLAEPLDPEHMATALSGTLGLQAHVETVSESDRSLRLSLS